MKNTKIDDKEEMKVNEIRETEWGEVKCVSNGDDKDDCYNCCCYHDGCFEYLYGCGECRGYYRSDGIEVHFELVK